jgi:N-acetylmuramoyl-L-alanine amidase
MSGPTQLRRRLLREAVDENLSTIEGKPAPRRDPGRRTQAGPGRWLLIVAAAAAAAAALWYFASTSRQSPVAPAAAVIAKPAAAPASPPPEDPASQLTFPAPRPIDPRVFSFEVRRITLDPGHGGDDHGTRSGELSEKDLTLDIARRLRTELEREDLEQGSFEVHLTRDGDDTLSLRERAELANRLKSDLFVSIHINWLATRQVRGVETYYLGPTEDPELTALARIENRQSGYSLAEMRGILDRIYTDFLQSQSHGLARRIQRALFASLLSVNPELRDRGVKTAPFVVLVSAEMPAILAEVSCLSNQQEVELLTRPLYREHIAQALARGIRRYADDVNQTGEKEADG